MAEMLRALTVWQPWASLIIVGAKPYEFRGHKPPRTIVGKRIVIHAAARPIDRNEVRALIATLNAGGDRAAETCLHADKAMPVLERAMTTSAFTERGHIDLRAHGDLPWGVGLGTALVGEGRNGFEIAEDFGVQSVNDSDRDQHANYGWPMNEIDVWEQPIEARGQQGIWIWPTPAAAGL